MTKARLRRFLGDAVRFVAARIGSDLRDHRTGRTLGRAFLIPWRGAILVIGFRPAPGGGNAIPVFLPQERLTYWKQRIGFTSHPPPDFPSLERKGPPSP